MSKFLDRYFHALEALADGSPGLWFALVFLSVAIPTIVIFNVIVAVVR